MFKYNYYMCYPATMVRMEINKIILVGRFSVKLHWRSLTALNRMIFWKYKVLLDLDLKLVFLLVSALLSSLTILGNVTYCKITILIFALIKSICGWKATIKISFTVVHTHTRVIMCICAILSCRGRQTDSKGDKELHNACVSIGQHMFWKLIDRWNIWLSHFARVVEEKLPHVAESR